MNSHLPADDLDHILTHTESLWEGLRGRRLFLTGGTGFFGCWLLESFIWANDRLDLNANVVVLSRGPDAFARKMPHLARHSSITLHQGDVRTFAFPVGSFTHVIHAATDANASLIVEQPLAMLDTIVEGTRRVLDFARTAGVQRFLLTSSGAVYGRQPSETTHVLEEYLGAPDPLSASASYGEGKRLSELLCSVYARQYGFDAVIARCFAFVGPHLPLDGYYAVGNFLRDGLQGKTIRVGGDGTPYRSYLYASDLAIWLWTLLFMGQSARPYNVGSEDEISIADLASCISRHFGGVPVEIAKTPPPNKPPERYVPSTDRARAELGLRPTVTLEQALDKTVQWHRAPSALS
ncbi:MAG: NAD-dependent epimerase/dehydratase family protein [Janthinobacterium lividum]